MTFQEIDLTYDSIGNGIPIEIKVIYGKEFYENELLNRFQKLSGENHLSFTPYGDYWKFIDDWKCNKVFGENGEIIENIVPYYEAYSKGFMDGYFEFESEIKELNQIFNQNSLPIEKIFDEIKSFTLPFSSRGFYYPNDDPKQKAIPILDKSSLLKGGKKIGRNYKAWFYILKNPKPFVALFRSFYFETYKLYDEEFRKWHSHIEGYISPLQIVIEEIKNDNSLRSESNLEVNTIQQPKIENTFNSMPIELVREHFSLLTKMENKSGQIWMTQKAFDTFIKRSFLGHELPKPKIKIGTRGKYAVIKLFYHFYEKSISENLHENRSKKPFVELLKNAFDLIVFDNLREDNFKLDKSKYDWK